MQTVEDTITNVLSGPPSNSLAVNVTAARAILSLILL